MGYDLALFLAQVDENFICGYCQSVYEAAVTACPQGHAFCDSCCTAAKQLGSVCPAESCGMDTSRHVPAPCLPIQKMANLLAVRCSGMDDGNERCQWAGTLGDYNAHRAACPLALLVCNFSGCSHISSRQHLRAHQRTCPFKPVVCQYCAEEFPPFLLQAHLDETCPEVPPCHHLGHAAHAHPEPRSQPARATWLAAFGCH